MTDSVSSLTRVSRRVSDIFSSALSTQTLEQALGLFGYPPPLRKTAKAKTDEKFESVPRIILHRRVKLRAACPTGHCMAVLLGCFCFAFARAGTRFGACLGWVGWVDSDAPPHREELTRSGDIGSDINYATLVDCGLRPFPSLAPRRPPSFPPYLRWSVSFISPALDDGFVIIRVASVRVISHLLSSTFFPTFPRPSLKRPCSTSTLQSWHRTMEEE
jgi:hypothetical protein